MAEQTKIGWADKTWRPWHELPNGARRRAADSAWKKPLRWNREVEAQKEPLIFPKCDPFEDFDGPIADAKNNRLLKCECGKYYPDLDEGTLCTACGTLQCRMDWATFSDLRRDLFRVIDRCSNLIFPLLTKRPGNIRRFWPDRVQDESEHYYCEEPFVNGNGEWQDGVHRCRAEYRENCYLLYSASNQPTLEAGWNHLATCRDLVPVIGLSLEPLLGPIVDHSLAGFPGDPSLANDWTWADFDWVIVGGESGPNFRPMEMEWLVSIVEQCKEAGVPCYVKQDCGKRQGQQGRIPDAVWRVKEFPR